MDTLPLLVLDAYPGGVLYIGESVRRSLADEPGETLVAFQGETRWTQ